MEPLAPSSSLSWESEPWGVEDLVVLTLVALSHAQLHPQGPQAMCPSPRSHCVVVWPGALRPHSQPSSHFCYSSSHTLRQLCPHWVNHRGRCLRRVSAALADCTAGPPAPMPSLMRSNLSLHV